MTTLEAAPLLGMQQNAVQKAIREGRLRATKSPLNRYDIAPDAIEEYNSREERARSTAAQVAAKDAKRKAAPPPGKPSPLKRTPGQPIKAKQLAEILDQMGKLAAEAEALAEGMVPAQVEYAGRLLWDRMDDDHRALHIAFVDTQVKARRRAAG